MQLLLSYPIMCKAHNPSERWHGDTMPSTLTECDEDYWAKYFTQDQTCHQILINVYVLLVRSSLFKILQWYLIWLFRSVLKQIKTSCYFFSQNYIPTEWTGILPGLLPPLSSLCVFSDISLTRCGLLILLPPRCYVFLHPSSKACSIVTYIIKMF